MINPETQNPAGYKGYRGNRTGGALGSVSSAVSHFPSRVKQGSVSSGSVPPSAYGGSYAQYAPTSGSSSAAAAQAAAQAKAIRRQRRARQARQVQRKVERQRKARSGQDLKTAKIVAKGLRKIAKSTPKPPKGTNTAPVNTEDSRPRVRATPTPPYMEQRRYVRRPEGNATPTPRREGLTTAKKPRRVAHRLEKAVRKAGPDVSSYKSLGPAAPQIARAASKFGPKYGVKPSLLMAIAENETGFGSAAGSGTPGSGAVSSAGAQGYMQFMPSSRDTVLKATGHDAFSKSPKEATAAAAGYFKVFAPDAKSDWDRAYSYNHADWYADQVTADQKKYSALDKAKLGQVPTKLKRTARQTLGRRPTKAILRGGKVVKDKDAGEGTGPVKVDSARQEVKAGAIEKATKKEDKYFSYDHSTDRAWFDPILKEQLVKLAKASGEPIQLNSGFRTRGEQKAAYADYQSGGALAATPGSSNHEYGLAADISLTDTQRSMLSKFGLGLPVGGEDWHVEVTDPSLKAKQTAVNLGTSGSATVTGGDTNIPIQGTKLAVKLPAEPSTTSPAISGTTALTGSLSPSTATGAPTASGGKGKAKRTVRRRRRDYSPYADTASGYYSIDPDTYKADPLLARLAQLAAQ